MTDLLLELENVTKQFSMPSGQSIRILHEINLAVRTGEIIAVIGPSGSGKSTLLNILGLLEQATSGTYRCRGIDTATLSDTQRSRLRGEFLGFIFQQFFLLDRRTALENVAEPLLFGSSSGLLNRHQRAHQLLDDVGLTSRASSMPHLLSGGEQQRVAIARALIRRPQVILADEPTGSLDLATGTVVLDLLLERVRAEGVSLILVTHDAEIARRADRILLLNDSGLEPVAR